jgi:predicted phage terminase large subunit-like protein
VAAPTSSDVQGTCFEGESGLLAVIPQTLIKQYIKQPRPTITLINGSMLVGIPASEPERFRGPQWHGAWLDELAAWDYITEAWDQIQLSVRLGKRTRTIITTTPRPKDLILDLLGRDGEDVAVTTASTYANLANLSDNFRNRSSSTKERISAARKSTPRSLTLKEPASLSVTCFAFGPRRSPSRGLNTSSNHTIAPTPKTANDPTACIVFGVFKPLDGPMAVMVIDCWQERLQYPDLRPKVIDEFATVFGDDKNPKRVDLILVEDKSAGISLIQDLQRAHLPVRAYNPGRADKMQRLNIVSNIIAAGRVWIPESQARKGFVRDWAEGFVSQICAFPETTHDDFVDAATQALRFLRDSGWLEIDPPPRDDWDDDDFADSGQSKRVNPYAI